MSRIAAFDIGSNSLLLAVGEPVSSGDFRILNDHARTTGLGRGLARTGRLSADGIRSTLAGLTAGRRKTEILGVETVRAVATAAVREATNPESLLEPAAEILGFPVEVLSGEREAELTFKAVVGSGIRDPLLLIDLGGASTEIILARGGRLERVWSLPVGATRLAETEPSEDPVRYRAAVTRHLPAELAGSQGSGCRSPRRVVVVGGTATTLGSIRLQLRHYDPEQVEGTTFSHIELEADVDRLRGMNADERRAVPGLPASRAPIIVSGALLLSTLLDAIGVDKFAVSTRGIRHGILAEIARGGGH